MIAIAFYVGGPLDRRQAGVEFVGCSPWQRPRPVVEAAKLLPLRPIRIPSDDSPGALAHPLERVRYNLIAWDQARQVAVYLAEEEPTGG